MFDKDTFFVDLLHGGFGSSFALLYGGDFFAEVDFGFTLGEACQFLLDKAFDLFAADAVLCSDGGNLVVADLVRGDGGIHGGVDGAVNVFGLLVKLGDLLFQLVHFANGGVGFRRGIVQVEIQFGDSVVVVGGNFIQGEGTTADNGKADHEGKER